MDDDFIKQAHEEAYRLGESIAMIGHNIPVEEHDVVRGIIKSDYMNDCRRGLCKAAAYIYNYDGETTKAKVFEDLSKVANWTPELCEFLAPVSRVFGGYGQIINEAYACIERDGTLTKEAVAGLATAGHVINRTSGLMPGLLKALIAAAVIVPGAASVLAWKANRATEEEDKDIEATKAKIQEMREIRKDLDEELEWANASNTPDFQDDLDAIRNFQGS